MFRLWRRRPILVSAFLLATALTLFFGFRFVRYTLYWSDPAHHEEVVQGWMTVGYIGKSWHLDPLEIDRLAGLPVPEHGHPLTLRQIAAMRSEPLDMVIAAVEAAITELRKAEAQP